MLTALIPARRNMVSGTLSSGALGEDRQAAVAYLGKPASNGDALRLAVLRAVDRDFAILQGRHVGRMTGHDAGIALAARDDDHVDVVGHDEPVGGDELEMQIGHYFLPSISLSNACVAASNLSRQPVSQKPTTLPL